METDIDSVLKRSTALARWLKAMARSFLSIQFRSFSWTAVMLLSFFWMPPAEARLGLQFIGGVTQSLSDPAMVSQTSGVSLSGSFKGMGTDLGLGFGLPLSATWRLELAAVYSIRQIEFALTRGTETVESGTLSLQTLYVPLLLRRNFGKFFSVTMGPYVEPTLSANNVDDPQSVGSYPSDAGVTVGGRIRVPLGKTWSFFVDGRYNLGFSGIEGVENTSTRQVLILSGFGWYLD